MRGTRVYLYGVTEDYGYLLGDGGTYSKVYSIWESILGSPYFGKLPYSITGLGLRAAGAVSAVASWRDHP